MKYRFQFQVLWPKSRFPVSQECYHRPDKQHPAQCLALGDRPSSINFPSCDSPSLNDFWTLEFMQPSLLLSRHWSSPSPSPSVPYPSEQGQSYLQCSASLAGVITHLTQLVGSTLPYLGPQTVSQSCTWTTCPYSSESHLSFSTSESYHWITACD